jgi:uncharacterized metal-binding protein YceD (DUF177 family)
MTKNKRPQEKKYAETGVQTGVATESLSRRIAQTLAFPFSDIPFDGLDIRSEVTFKELDFPSMPPAVDEDHLTEIFTALISVEATVFPVATKVDLRGKFSTTVSGICDRCTAPAHQKIEGSFSTFLMPQTQFSEHDKPGGKVIHGPTRDLKPSRHHSKSKAPVLSDAEGEHEDVNFGAFDGHMVDLRPLVREHLILQLPMRMLCTEDCRGLCLKCGENINEARCICKEGPTLVFEEAPLKAEGSSPLAAALEAKLKKQKTF